MQTALIPQSSLLRAFPARRMFTSKADSTVDRILRVDHAGELGADRIYAGQMAVLGNSPVGPTIQHMWDQEKAHLAKFEDLIRKHRARPTVMLPLWNVAGFVLGAGSALLGPKAAMACTVAVESVIVEHYDSQLRELVGQQSGALNHELLETIRQFRDDEQDHHDTGLANEAESAPFYNVLSAVIKAGCRTAIAISEAV